MSGQDLKIRNLAGVRGYSLLFSGLDFDCSVGAFIVLKGPNGSGKTTLLRILAGLMSPEAGTIETPEEHREQGPFYMGHETGLRPNETPISHLKDWADLHHADRKPIDDVLERVGLAKRKIVPAYALSAGQKKRLGLARALLVQRKLWLLDEPSAALDVAGQGLLCELIKDHCAKGGICMAALHDPIDLEADHVLDLAEYRP